MLSCGGACYEHACTWSCSLSPNKGGPRMARQAGPHTSLLLGLVCASHVCEAMCAHVSCGRAANTMCVTPCCCHQLAHDVPVVVCCAARRATAVSNLTDNVCTLGLKAMCCQPPFLPSLPVTVCTAKKTTPCAACRDSCAGRGAVKTQPNRTQKPLD